MFGLACSFLKKLRALALSVLVLSFAGKLLRLMSGRDRDGCPAFVFSEGFEQGLVGIHFVATRQFANGLLTVLPSQRACGDQGKVFGTLFDHFAADLSDSGRVLFDHSFGEWVVVHWDIRTASSANRRWGVHPIRRAGAFGGRRAESAVV